MLLVVQYYANAFISPPLLSRQRVQRKNNNKNIAQQLHYSPLSADDGDLQLYLLSSAQGASVWSETRAPSGRKWHVFVGMRGIVGEIPDTSVIVSHAVGRANA
jgi:hypothetical protein